ncbi:Arginase/deacetylase [Meredithblackwellia eburnea MCA 4105]
MVQDGTLEGRPDRSNRPRMTVFHSKLSLLHDPPYEILSGNLQPYLESPERYHRILAALREQPASSPTSVDTNTCSSESLFEEVELEWKRDEVLVPWLMTALEEVHGKDYLSFLETIYKEWINEGGSKTAALPETFLRCDFLLEPDPGAKEGAGAIEKIGRHSFDLSCPITGDTWVAAIASARLALEATKHLLNATSESNTRLSSTFALCRPPGHHATPTLCGGYCYLNNAAVVAKFIQANAGTQSMPGSGKLKVAILDIDYHHGNGTSKVFYRDPSVLYVSLHGSPDYPYFTGAETERGAGEGKETNINYPLPLGTSNETYLATLSKAVSRIKEWRAAFLVVSLGVDTYIDDPITQFNITSEAYPEMGKLIGALRAPTVFLMEGGYFLPKIGFCVRGVLEGFLAAGP